MSLDTTGLETKSKEQTVVPQIKITHPLVQLSNCLDWQKLFEMTAADLKRGMKWHLGRKLILRIHRAVFLLQSLRQFTDRQMEQELGDNGAYQVFCGYGVVEKWHCPDHTRIEAFRNRLTPDTQHRLVQEVLQLAKREGYADPSWMDIDSTVQEANVAYPSDARLLLKLSEKVAQGLKAVQSHQGLLPIPSLDLKTIKEKAKTYFFLNKTTKVEKKREVFKELYEVTRSEVEKGLKALETLPEQVMNRGKFYDGQKGHHFKRRR